MRSPLFAISISFLCGIIAASISIFKSTPFIFAPTAAFISFLLFILFFNNKKISVVFLFLVVFFSGFARFMDFNSLPRDHVKYLLDSYSGDIILKGMISDNPVFKRKFFYCPELEFTLDLKAVKEKDAWRGASGFVIVKTMYSGKNRFDYGDIIILEGSLEKPKASILKSGFDYKAYLEHRKIFGTLWVKSDNHIKKIGLLKTPLAGIKRLLYSIRAKMRDLILIRLCPPHSSVLAAMLFGDRQYLDKATNDLFLKTGTLHILAISGLHIAIIAFIFLGLFKLLKIPYKISCSLTILIILLYSIMVVGRASVWRSTIMGSFILLGVILGKQNNILNALGLSLLILMFADPNYIYDVGFILSFACILSIIWVSPVVDEILGIKKYGSLFIYNRLRAASVLHKAVFYVLKSFSVSLGVWLGILPIIAYYFKLVTPVTIMANLVAVPASSVLLGLGIFALLAGMPLPFLEVYFYKLIWLTNAILLSSLNMLSKLPFAYIEIKPVSFPAILFYYAILGFLIKWADSRRK